MNGNFSLNSTQWHMVRFGTHGEARYLSGDFLNTYDVLIVNGNMAAFTAGAMAEFIAERTANKPYIIDPQTHAFQHDLKYIKSPKTGEVKTSIDRLLSFYGEPFKSSIQDNRPVSSGDFSDDSLLTSVVERVITFQKKVFASQEGDWSKYYNFLNIKFLQPLAVVAPYFFMDELTAMKWLEINTKAVATAKDKFPEETIIMQLVIDKGVLLNSELLEEIIDRVLDTPADIVAIWIDEFDETAATITELLAYRKMLQKLGTRKPIIILYGSFFSVALMKTMPELNIIGVCHSLEYGEHRPVIPVGGGLPVSKFYYPSLHIRIPYVDVLSLVRPYLDSMERYLQNVCDCNTCKAVMREANDPEEGFSKYGEGHPVKSRRRNQVVTINFPTPEARALSVQHYMWRKANEYKEKLRSASEVAERLEKAAKECSIVGNSFTGHCLRWAKVLRG
ncbi:MAG: hypothetical protein AB2448_11310 [Moorella sp. (in: firmicutes)]